MASASLDSSLFPGATPITGNESLFSICCGNSRLSWANHHGSSENFNPELFWKTPHLGDDVTEETCVAVLSRNLPDKPHDCIFGAGNEATVENAQKQAKVNGLVCIYIVSTNSKQEHKLAKLWNSIPCRLFVMKGGDFFHRNEGRYDSMGADRLAALSGASYLHGHPCLVFDGGTATTYSATNITGQIIGGGIGPGLQSKLKAMRKDTEALPAITTEEVIARLHEAQESGKPLPTFARNTKEAMMSSVFQDMALKGRNVIDQWLRKAYEQGVDPPTTTMDHNMFNRDRKIVCTGGDGGILMQLLQPNFGGVVEMQMSNDPERRKFELELSKNLQHYGIASVLSNHFNKRMMENHAHLGKRVAKEFNVDGTSIFRGTVIKVILVDQGKEEFNVSYDDGDSEQVSAAELEEMFKLFHVHGEKKKEMKLASNGQISLPAKNKAPEEAAGNKRTKRTKPADPLIGMVENRPTDFVQRRVAKDFDGDCFYGNLTAYDDSETPVLWHVVYDDGDEEDYTKKDLLRAVKHYEANKLDDPKL